MEKEQEYKNAINVFRYIQRWFMKLNSRADREYIIKKLQERIDEYEGTEG